LLIDLQNIKGFVTETLVFDCALPTYSVLNELMRDNIKFITLRKRNKTLLEGLSKIANENWQKLTLQMNKRKHKSCLVYESDVSLKGCSQLVRQIVIKGHGREQPTFMITNNRELPLKDILIIYAKRWHVENKFGELVLFFNLNALSSPLMVRIHFDILWTVIADTLYHRFAQDLPRFERKAREKSF
jgi:IS4 transposase